jgi:hypothetical protein
MPYTSSFLLRSCRVVYHLLRRRLRPPPPPPALFSRRDFVPQAQMARRLLKPASALPRSYCHRFQIAECVQPSPHLSRGRWPCVKIRFAVHLPSRLPRSYGHPFQLAEGTSPRGLTYHCTNNAVYFIFPAAQLPSCLSPAAAASPPPPSPLRLFSRRDFVPQAQVA